MKKESCDYCGKEGYHEYRPDNKGNSTLTTVTGGDICGDCYEKDKQND